MFPCVMSVSIESSAEGWWGEEGHYRPTSFASHDPVNMNHRDTLIGHSITLKMQSQCID